MMGCWMREVERMMDAVGGIWLRSHEADQGCIRACIREDSW